MVAVGASPSPGSSGTAVAVRTATAVRRTSSGSRTSPASAPSRPRLAEIAADLTALEARRTDIAQDLAALDALRTAHQHRVDVTWDAVDVAGADAALARLEDERQALLAADDGLRTLRESVARLRAALDEAADRRSAARLGVKRLEERHGVLVDGQDAAAEILERFADAPERLPDEQQERLLAEAFDEVGAPDGVDGFDDATKRLRRRLEERLSQALDGAATASVALTTTFERYQDAWPDPNLGTGVASYPDYRAILDQIVATGLHARRSEWRRRLSQWSGEDLVPLSGAFDRAVVEIEERLEPVNEILRDLPFGANRDRLKIVIRRVTREDVTQFRKEAPRAVGVGGRRADRRRARDALPAAAAVHGGHPPRSRSPARPDHPA